MARGLILLALAAVAASGLIGNVSANRAGSGGESLIPPVVVAAWNCSGCIQTAMAVLRNNGTAIDAVVAGVIIAENDTSVHSVGWGGSPDEAGETTLDALVTDGRTMNMGAVASLRNVREAAMAAKLVLEHTTHTMLAGSQATDFAVQFGGYPRRSLTSNYSEEVHQQWLNNSCQPNYWVEVTPNHTTSCGPYKPLEENIESLRQAHTQACLGPDHHDTLPMLAIDSVNNIAAATTTNGLTNKIPGRVGDSPIPGAGNYARNGVGACGATGNGDVMMRFLPCATVVESMRLGYSPQDAVEDAIQRISHYYPNFGGHLVAVNASGAVGAASSGMDFTYLVMRADDTNGPQLVHVTPKRRPLPPGLTGGKTLSESEKATVQRAMSGQSHCENVIDVRHVLNEDGEGGLVALGMIFGVIWSITLTGLLLLFGVLKFGCGSPPSHASKKMVS